MQIFMLFVLFFQCISLLSCKSLDSSSKSMKTIEMKSLTFTKKTKGSDVMYELLGINYYSENHYAQGIYIARSFEDAISIMEGNGKNDFSKIDFENEALIFVFAGTFNTGGYAIKVDSIKRTEKNKISAVFSITSPAPDSIVTQAFTRPSIVVSVKVGKADIIQASFK